jgi:hypothetical protein
MKVSCLLINCYTLQSNCDKTCCNKWDYMFMFKYSMTRFEHIFQKQMLKASYVFIQQHHFIDIENRIFVEYMYHT